MSAPPILEAALSSPAVTDAPRLATLARDSFTETFGHLYSPVDLAAFLAGHATEEWAAILADPDNATCLAEMGGEAVGYARLGQPALPFEAEPGAVELRQFYVLRPWHGSGLADRMMEWALAEAAQAPALYLSVFEVNDRAKRFYARHGFAFVTTHAFMVGEHRDTDHILRRVP